VNEGRYGNLPIGIFNIMTSNKAIGLFNDKLDGLMMLFLSISKKVIYIATKYTTSRQRQFIKKVTKKLSNITI